jgi:hypothetical protein
MKEKITLSVMYSLTAVSIGLVLEAIYSGEPITRYQLLVNAAVIGLFCFAAAAVTSLVKLRIGVIIGLIAVIASGPYFVLECAAIPWRNLAWFAQFRTGTLMAISLLVISTLYSISILLRLRAD